MTYAQWDSIDPNWTIRNELARFDLTIQYLDESFTPTTMPSNSKLLVQLNPLQRRRSRLLGEGMKTQTPPFPSMKLFTKPADCSSKYPSCDHTDKSPLPSKPRPRWIPRHVANCTNCHRKPCNQTPWRPNGPCAGWTAAANTDVKWTDYHEELVFC